MHTNTPSTVECCITGGGPAGVVLALLLARQGVEVLLLEAHLHFDRDFRGDIVHPSTLDLLEQLGLLDRLFALPHAKLSDFPFHFPDGSVSPPSRSRLRTKHPNSLQVPQAQLLGLLVDEARRYPSFHLAMGARVDQLIREDGTVRGVRYSSAEGRHEVRAALVVGADGRFSKVRQLAAVPLLGAAEPIDVLWLRLPHGPTDPERGHGIYFGSDGQLVLLDRGDAWQVGYIFAKGAYQRLRSAGLDALRQSIAELAPWLANRTDCLQDWRQTSLLSVEIGRVERWYQPGLLLIGDAAHVMSPVAGVGTNYAIQDAIVTSNIVGPRLRCGALRTADLAAVQTRRELPTRLMQFLQRQMRPRFEPNGQVVAGQPIAARLMDLPPLVELRSRLIGFGGLQPERVREPKERTALGLRFASIARAVGAFMWSALLQADIRYLMVLGGVAWWPPAIHGPEHEIRRGILWGSKETQPR